MGTTKQKKTIRKVTRSKTPDGGGQLRTAVVILVAKESEEIAKALVAQTKKGNMTGAKLVVDLTGARNPREMPPKKRRGPSEAQRLATNKQWVEPPEQDRDVSIEELESLAACPSTPRSF
jgi:hypothetical protein